MKNIKWFVAIVVAFVAGYFSNTTAEKNSELQNNNSSSVAPVATVTQSVQKTTSSAVLVSNISKPTKSSSHSSAQTEHSQHPQKSAPDIQPTPGKLIVNESSGRQAQPLSKEELAAKYPNDISDEEIDRVIPPPFNTQLKSSHGGTREKYKDFVAASQPQNWDTNMQNKISDSILSSPYAKFIKMDSLLCKANMCEIRLYETKDNVWSLILAEMALQDWWEIGNYDSYGFATELDSKQITGYYVLLTRR
ncbi:MAG: hypothetical protein ABW044_13095 [Cellvibrio sp.]